MAHNYAQCGPGELFLICGSTGYLEVSVSQGSAAKLIERYAQRMLVENHIADGIDFFHMDALSSVVALRVTCDLQLTLMASSLYRLLGQRIGNGYEVAVQHVHDVVG